MAHTRDAQSLSVTESVTAQCGGVHYVLRFPAEREVPEWTPEIQPALVVTSTSPSTDLSLLLKGKLGLFQRVDDVYTAGFAKNAAIFLQTTDESETSKSNISSPMGIHKLLRLESTASSLLPEGPYFWRGNCLHQAWRLYADTLGAFVTPIIPSSSSGSKYSFQPLLSAAEYGNTLAVAVPSRLYFKATEDKPLNGMRIAIKDNIHLEGVKTSNGNRAYLELYGPQPDSAFIAKELINKGAVIVGKTKLNAFSGAEKPPDQTIDWLAPWNPRGDGYQRAAGSSSGAGVSVSGYDWMDCAIGTDTTGSMREPARATGLYGLKLTNRIISADGLEPSCTEIDSYGLVTRSISDMYKVISSVVGDRIKDTEKLPSKLLYPTDWLPYKQEKQQKLNEEFLLNLEIVLGVQHTKICLADEWTRTAPESLRNTPISEYLKDSGFWPLYYDNYHHYDKFRQDYRQAFGKEPYVSPPQTWKWELGSKVTAEERERGMEEIAEFKLWVDSHILTKDAEGQPDAIIFLPLGNARPEWRDTPNKVPTAPVKSFEPKYFGSILGLPQIVLPIAQLPYDSRVSKRVEYTPVIATFAGPKGSDMMLIRVAEAALKAGGYPTTVPTGRFTFPVAENFRNIATDSDEPSAKLA